MIYVDDPEYGPGVVVGQFNRPKGILVAFADKDRFYTPEAEKRLLPHQWTFEEGESDGEAA